MDLNLGSVAPDFSLMDQNGQLVRLADFKGKQSVVLIFYPGDQTPGCTRQLCTARDDSVDYEKAGVAVFGVNQASATSHEKFVNKHGLTTPLLVDKGLEVSHRYYAVQTLGSLSLRFIKRTVVGIDKEGRIAFYKHGMPNTREILAALTNPVTAQ